LKRLLSGEPSNPDPLQDLHYTYDAVGNVETIQDSQAGVTQTQRFTYDALDRLESAQASGGSGGTYSESYAYDAIGNLTSKNDVGTYYYEDADHKHAVTHIDGTDPVDQRYWYDANGNMTKRQVDSGTYDLIYDAENRLTAVSGAASASFTYDGDGVRVRKESDGHVTVYVGQHYERETGQFEIAVPDAGFESGGQWSHVASGSWPGTSIWRGTWGTANPHSGSRAEVISNHAYGYLQSDEIAVSANTQYDLYAYVRGELDPEDSGGQWTIRAYFYNSSGGQISYTDAAKGVAGTLNTTWQSKGGRITTPAGTVKLRIRLYNYSNSGWVAYDDVSLKRVGSGTNLAPNPGFESSSGWTEKPSSVFPGTSIWRSTWGIGSPRSGSYAYSISNLHYGWVWTPQLEVAPETQYNVQVYARGEIVLRCALDATQTPTAAPAVPRVDAG
jgi:hypothetical protein